MDLEKLGKKHLAFVLVFIEENPGLIQDEFLSKNEDGQRVKLTRLKELIEMGYVAEIPSKTRHWNALEYHTTDEGSNIAIKLIQIRDDTEMNYGTPSRTRDKVKQ
jgi:hypothetical protein